MHSSIAVHCVCPRGVAGHPEWGNLKLGMADPQVSQAALASLLSATLLQINARMNASTLACGPRCLTDRLINSSFTADVCRMQTTLVDHLSPLNYAQAMQGLDSLMRHMDMLEADMMVNMLRRGPSYLDALVTYEHNGLSFARISKKAFIKEWGHNLVFTVLRYVVIPKMYKHHPSTSTQWWIFLQHPPCVHP